MRTYSTRSGIGPVLRRLLLGAGIFIAGAVAISFSFDLVPYGREEQVKAAPVPTFEQRALTGHLVRIQDGMLVVEGGEGELSVHVHPKTEVVRGVGLSLVTDYDLTRLQLNDSLWVAAEVHDDGTMFARQITANGFVTRDGVIEARGAGFIDVMPRLSRVDEGLAAEPMRVWISPAARVEWLDAGGARSMGYVTDLLVGRRVHFQGFRNDDGTWVATFLWPSRL
jgi:hypothetical protein